MFIIVATRIVTNCHMHVSYFVCIICLSVFGLFTNKWKKWKCGTQIYYRMCHFSANQL